MKYRLLGKTGFKVSEISFGAWAIGGNWGNVAESDAIAAINKAIDLGVNFIDTADVYGDGRSEKIIAKVLKGRKERVFVATKTGRRLSPHIASGYTKQNLNKFVERSRKNLKMDTLDLLQLHCPPTEVFYNPEVFEALDEMIIKKKIKNYGVSVEKVEEGIKALQYSGVATVQIIYNIFRQRPAEIFFDMAKEKNVGIIVRVPLASGLLTGKMNKNTVFDKTDHRLFNRHGEAFDVGETFAGVPFEKGLQAVNDLAKIIPAKYSMSQFALKWILMQDAVSTIIPGGKNPVQVESNVLASDLPNLSKESLKMIDEIYKSKIKALVHERW
ncbi:MAG: aldo/keto reductase [Patescibacteria group bacterium]